MLQRIPYIKSEINQSIHFTNITDTKILTKLVKSVFLLIYVNFTIFFFLFCLVVQNFLI